MLKDSASFPMWPRLCSSFFHHTSFRQLFFFTEALHYSELHYVVSVPLPLRDPDLASIQKYFLWAWTRSAASHVVQCLHSTEESGICCECFSRIIHYSPSHDKWWLCHGVHSSIWFGTVSRSTVMDIPHGDWSSCKRVLQLRPNHIYWLPRRDIAVLPSSVSTIGCKIRASSPV